MADYDTPLTDAEYAELEDMLKALRTAYAADPKGVAQAWKDMAHFPAQRGDLKA
jgi:hypothetical protein